jgi:hypothetical protein
VPCSHLRQGERVCDLARQVTQVINAPALRRAAHAHSAAATAVKVNVNVAATSAHGNPIAAAAPPANANVPTPAAVCTHSAAALEDSWARCRTWTLTKGSL